MHVPRVISALTGGACAKCENDVTGIQLLSRMDTAIRVVLIRHFLCMYVFNFFSLHPYGKLFLLSTKKYPFQVII